MAPEGLTYLPAFLDDGRQRALLARLEAIPDPDWERIPFRGVFARRRKISYGVGYQPDVRSARPAPPLPSWLAELRDEAAAALGRPSEPFVSASMQWYPPGAGIGPHRDAPMFGPEVFGLSLGAPGCLIFRRDDDKFEQRLESGSLVLLSGPARSQWTHEMPPVKAVRYSIYFRTLKR